MIQDENLEQIKQDILKGSPEFVLEENEMLMQVQDYMKAKNLTLEELYGTSEDHALPRVA